MMSFVPEADQGKATHVGYTTAVGHIWLSVCRQNVCGRVRMQYLAG